VHTLKVETGAHLEMVDVTAGVRRVVKEAGIARGICHLFVPHTTAAITINETTDPNDRGDMIAEFLKSLPIRGDCLIEEGGAVSHVLSSLIGPSENVLVEDGRLVLGTWQAIYLCEFDGPRSRNVLLRVMAE
jgi:secondary thiamine-phosphate synthase enzyme